MAPDRIYCPVCGEPSAQRVFVDGPDFACGACHRFGQVAGFEQPCRPTWRPYDRRLVTGGDA